MSEIIPGTGVERNYEVESGIVTLNIVIGEGQLGASAVWLDQQLIQKGNVTSVILGPGSVLTGRALGIRSIVSDINPQTDRTAVTYVLLGGATTLDVTLTASVSQPGASIVYEALFHLTEKSV